jgi:hypothetical protein
MPQEFLGVSCPFCGKALAHRGVKDKRVKKSLKMSTVSS